MIEDLCYKNAVSYALNVDSFMDGNGDGCGDFEATIPNAPRGERRLRDLSGAR